MKSAELLPILRRGFSERLDRLESFKDPASKHLTKEQVLISSPYEEGQNVPLNLNALVPTTFSADMNYTECLGFLSRILPDQYKDRIISYYYSAESISYISSDRDEIFHDDVQHSIIAQTATLWGAYRSEEMNKAVVEGVAEIVEVLGMPRHGVSSLEELIGILGTFVPNVDVASVVDTKTFLVEFAKAKERLIHLIGPDLFALVLQGLDPRHNYRPDQIKQYVMNARLFRIEGISIRCMRLRQNRGSGLERVARLRSEWAVSLGATNYRHAKAVGVRADVLRSSLLGMQVLERAIAEGNAQKSIDAVIALYNIDVRNMEWINWWAVYQCIRDAARIVGVKAALMHLIMGQAVVREAFPHVALAEGDGAFESALRSAIGQLKQRSVREIAHAIKGLEGQARALMVAAVLQHDTALMICSIISYSPPWVKKLLKASAISFDARAAAFRHDAARVFLQEGLLSSESAAEIQRDAISALRVAYLRGRQLKGLVSIRLERAEEQLNSTYSESIHLVRRLLDTPDLADKAHYIETVSDQLASDVVDYILFSGPDDVRTTISDALRHGQIPNRFQQAFDKALTLTLPSVGDPSRYYARAENTPFEWLSDIRKALHAEIKQFNERNLSIDRGGILFQDLKMAVKSRVVGALTSSRSRAGEGPIWSEPEMELLSGAIRESIAQFLMRARDALAPQINQYFDYAASTISSRPIPALKDAKNGPNAQAFLENLKHQLAEAIRDCSQWMALAKNENLEITLHDIVQLCLVTHTSATGKPLSVTARTSERRGSEGIVLLSQERMLPAEMFEPIETICKNLIANIFQHSGLGRDSRAAIELILSADRMTIVSTNTVSLPRYRSLEGSLDQLERSVNQGKMSKAGDDKSSGFSKIRWACNRAFGGPPSIRFSLSSSPYTLKIEIDAARAPTRKR